MRRLTAMAFVVHLILFQALLLVPLDASGSDIVIEDTFAISMTFAPNPPAAVLTVTSYLGELVEVAVSVRVNCIATAVDITLHIASISIDPYGQTVVPFEVPAAIRLRDNTQPCQVLPIVSMNEWVVNGQVYNISPLPNGKYLLQDESEFAQDNYIYVVRY